jgi:hypothetical protein
VLKLVAFVALFGGFCWFGTTVPLGDHTLFGHLRAISGTKESQELFDGTRASAKPLLDNVRRRIAGMPERDDDKAAPARGDQDKDTPAPAPVAKGAGHPDAGAAPPQESVSDADRRRLRKLLTAAEHAAAQ